MKGCRVLGAGLCSRGWAGLQPREKLGSARDPRLWRQVLWDVGRDHGVLTTVWGRESDSASRWLHVHEDRASHWKDRSRGRKRNACGAVPRGGGERQRAESGSSPPLGIRPAHVPEDIRAGVKRRDSKGSACNKAGGSLSPLPSTVLWSLWGGGEGPAMPGSWVGVWGSRASCQPQAPSLESPAPEAAGVRPCSKAQKQSPGPRPPPKPTEPLRNLPKAPDGH